MPLETLSSPVEQLAANTAALAEAVSLAIRIEPQVLRKMRLALFPESDAGTEADLWFSAAVETRTSSGIVLHPAARETLRQQLGAKSATLEASWSVIESLHRDISPAIFAEEKLAYLALAGRQKEARELLRSVVATLVSSRGQALSAWAAQAADRLPQAARPLEEAQMMTFGANLRLGDEAPRNSGISAVQASEWAAWLSPDDLEMAPFGVALLEDAVEFGPVGRPSSHRLLLPKTNPAVVEVGWSDGVSRRTERAALKPDGLTFVELGPGVIEVDLKTVLGDSYTLIVPAARERKSGQKKIDRVRPPRVQISYDVESAGSIERKELPFIVAVLADLSGSKPLSGGKPSGPYPLDSRKLIQIDFDNFDAVMKVLKPRISIVVGDPANGARNFPASLEFLALEDFGPASVARQIGPTRELLERRMALAATRSLVSENEALGRALSKYMMQVGSDGLIDEEMGSSDYASSHYTTVEDIAHTGKLTLDRAQELTDALVANFEGAPLSRDLESSINGIIAMLDHQLSKWINPVLHDPAFQALEATWRGLNYLVRQTESGRLLKIQVWDVAKSDLARDFARAAEFDQTVAFKKLYEEAYGVMGGSPVGLIVGAYEFNRSPEDLALLKGMGAIAAASHAPFVAAASAAIFNLNSFEQLADPRDLDKIFDSQDAAGWRRLRASDEAASVALTLPHILLRLPYGADAPVEEFNFEEDAISSDHSKALWGNSAFAFAARITNSFATYQWPAAIRGVESGGLVEGLPAYTFTDQDGDTVLKCPTETYITDRREHELSRLGFIPLCHTRGTAMAAFFSASSIQKPPAYSDSEAQAAAQLSIRLPYRLAASRFVHYMNCMMRDKIGSFMSRENAERFLNAWISNYVQKEPNLSPSAKAVQPLQSAHVEIQEIEGRLGSFRATLFIRPDFLLDDTPPTDMRLVFDLPSAGSSSMPAF